MPLLQVFKIRASEFMNIFNLKKAMIPAMILLLMGCLDTNNLQDWDLGNQEYDLAVPLVNTKVSVFRLTELVKGNVGIKFDPDGRATVAYNGEVLRKNSAAIFPPYPGVIPLPIVDTISQVEIMPVQKVNIHTAIFKETKINFTVENNLAEDLFITMTIPELSKNGQIFVKKFTIPYKNTLPVTYQTEDISVDGWSLKTDRNLMTFHYQAVTKSGQKVKLDKAFMNFDLIKFYYLEGYLGHHDFPVDGNFINISLFDFWKSGTFDFEDPKITLSVENAFGLPVHSKVNKLELTSISGNTVQLESPFVNTGIDFLYPGLDEVGKIKTTYFDFNKANSNIRQIFNEKTKTVTYDMSALVNPDKDTTKVGFITDQSYFIVRVAAEIPLFGSVNQLVVEDTIDIDLPAVDHVTSAEIKAIFSNDFPTQVKVQARFLDEDNRLIDVLFDGEGLDIAPATLNNNNQTTTPANKTAILTFDKERYEKVRKAKKLAVSGFINTTNSDQKRSLWIYDRYGIGVKLGARLKVKK